jgi:hypothetical protein
MPIEAQQIEELVQEIDECVKSIATAVDRRAMLKNICVDDVKKLVPRDGAGNVDAAAWSQQSEATQQLVKAQLVQVLGSVHAAAGLDGPADPKHLMFDEYASTSACVVWLIIGAIVLAALLGSIAWKWNQATGTDVAQHIATAAHAQDAAANAAKQLADELTAQQASAAREQDEQAKKAASDAVEKARTEAAAKLTQAQTASYAAIEAFRKGGVDERSVAVMVMLLGALGGALHFVGSLVKFIGNRQLKRSWLPYYLVMPLTGAGLAILVYMLLRVGVISPSGTSTQGTALANLNLMAVYAFAALAGLFSKSATEKLAEVFSTFFKTSGPPSKDPIGAKKPPGNGAVPATTP